MNNKLLHLLSPILTIWVIAVVILWFLPLWFYPNPQDNMEIIWGLRIVGIALETFGSVILGIQEYRWWKNEPKRQRF